MLIGYNYSHHCKLCFMVKINDTERGYTLNSKKGKRRLPKRSKKNTPRASEKIEEMLLTKEGGKYFEVEPF